jgi:pantetheine-phosphate adenylyltransferase
LKTKALYAGSFDPITNGHLFIIKKGLVLFDELVIAIGENPEKKKRMTFSLDERLEMIEESVNLIPGKTTVSHYSSKYLVYYAQEIGATHILRGIRDQTDMGYEKRMAQINRDWVPEIETVFLMPDRDVENISSSFVKGLIGFEKWEDKLIKYVSKPVYTKFIEKYKE